MTSHLAPERIGWSLWRQEEEGLGCSLSLMINLNLLMFSSMSYYELMVTVQDHWQSEATISLPLGSHYKAMGVAGGICSFSDSRRLLFFA